MSDIKLFESKKVRSYWDEDEEKWYFSVTNIVETPIRDKDRVIFC